MRGKIGERGQVGASTRPTHRETFNAQLASRQRCRVEGGLLRGFRVGSGGFGE
jgi:hypothetical protein